MNHMEGIVPQVIPCLHCDSECPHLVSGSPQGLQRNSEAPKSVQRPCAVKVSLPCLFLACSQIRLSCNGFHDECAADPPLPPQNLVLSGSSALPMKDGVGPSLSPRAYRKTLHLYRYRQSDPPANPVFQSLVGLWCQIGQWCRYTERRWSHRDCSSGSKWCVVGHCSSQLWFYEAAEQRTSAAILICSKIAKAN